MKELGSEFGFKKELSKKLDTPKIQDFLNKLIIYNQIRNK